MSIRNRFLVAATAVGCVLGAAAPAFAHGSSQNQGNWGNNHGMGQGMMMQPLREDLSAAEVKHMMEHQLAWQGNSNLKLGKVEEKDADIIVAEVVTTDGSLVQRFEIDRHTGRMQPAQ